MRTTTKEFLAFLKEYKIVSLAVAFVMGAASTSLINSLVRDVFMPIVEPLMATGSWEGAIFQVGPIKIAYGSFLAELINFVVLASIIFIVVKKILKIEANEKIQKTKII